MPPSADRRLDTRRVTVPASGELPVSYAFRPDTIKLWAYSTFTTRLDVILRGAQGGNPIPMSGRGPIDFPGVSENQEIVLVNLDTVDRDIAIIAQRGYAPTVLNTPEIATTTQLGDPMAFLFVINGQGAVPAVGDVPGVLDVPFDCTITRARLVSDGGVAGDIAIDIKKNTLGGWPSTASICAADYLALSNSDTDEKTDPDGDGWSVNLSAGDVLEFEVLSSPTPADVTWVTVSLWVDRAS